VPVVVTFKHAKHKLSYKVSYKGSIFSYRQKMQMLEQLGISAVVVVEFTQSFKQMPGRDFLAALQERANLKFLAVGENFRCGYKQDTDALLLTELNLQKGIPTVIVPSLKEGTANISSSRIRAAISSGELKLAARLLGSPFTVDIAHYETEGCILPPDGKYGVYLLYGDNALDSSYSAGTSASEKVKAEIIIEQSKIKNLATLQDGAIPQYAQFL
jgi:FAD synthase